MAHRMWQVRRHTSALDPQSRPPQVVHGARVEFDLKGHT